MRGPVWSIGAATVAAALASGCGSGATSTSSELRPEPAQTAARGTFGSNQIVLTRRESERLVQFARDLRSCLAARGVQLGAPHATATLIEMSLRRTSPPRAMTMRLVPCAESLGGPPPRASLQAFSDRVVLYLPKQCLLDPKVAHANA